MKNTSSAMDAGEREEEDSVPEPRAAGGAHGFPSDPAKHNPPQSLININTIRSHVCTHISLIVNTPALINTASTSWVWGSPCVNNTSNLSGF